MAGDIGNRKGTSLLKPHAVWYRKRFVLSGNGLLSESTIGEDRHDPVPRHETRHPNPTLHHDTRRFPPRAKGYRRPCLVAPGYHEGIGVIHRRRFDSNQHLAGSRLRWGNILKREILHLSPGPADHGTHGRTPPTGLLILCPPDGA